MSDPAEFGEAAFNAFHPVFDQSMNRRHFLRTTFASSLALHALPAFALKAGNPYRQNIGIQLYTLRNQIKTDLARTIKTVADAGYRQVEAYGFADETAMNLIKAARANGMIILDGVCNAIEDQAMLEAECVQARDSGFDGKTLIHPAQLDACNRVFAPTIRDIADAEAIVTAFADPANAGKGALRVNGKMAELLHLAQAERLLAKAAAIATR